MRTLLEGVAEGEADSSGVDETEGDSSGISETEVDSSGVGECVGASDSCANSAQADAKKIRIATLSFFVMSSRVETSLAVLKESKERREIPRLRSE